MTVCFIAALVLLAYSYVGYPLVLHALGTLWSLPSPDRYESFPSVTMVVPVHNESDVIRQKMLNTQSVDYPGEFRCLFVSDSTDETDTIVHREMTDWIDLLTLDERRGKSHAINRALDAVNSEVVVFSDANTMYEPDAVRELVAPLGDPGIGCVTGRLRLFDPEGESGEGLYWWYELWLRELEATIGTTVSTNGGMLAFRRDDIDPLPERALADDLVLTLRQAMSGRRIHYAADAVATEHTAGGVFAEFSRRVRIGAGNYQALVWFPHLLAPTQGIVALEYVSHKVLRWLGPWLLLLALTANAALVALTPNPISVATLAVQVVGYTLALVGLVSDRMRRFAIARIPAYFVAMNAALAVGCLRVLVGATEDIWTVTGRPE